MSDADKELGYFEVTQELERLALEFGYSPQAVQYSFEKKQFQLQLRLGEISDSAFLDVISLAKKYIENWRIHTYEKGYLVLQALNHNLFSSERLLDNLKIRLSAIYGERLLEISRKGNPLQSEVSLMTALLKYFAASPQSDPLDLLQRAGCQVFLPGHAGSFAGFAGYADIKNAVTETIVYPLRHPEVYDQISRGTRAVFEANRPRAVLFAGPPGVGKTTMARLLASECGLPMVYIPLENIMSAYYGESSKRLAMIFDIAAEAGGNGLILFLDEIDALAPSRNEKLFEATRRMLSVLLRKIEGLESKNTLTIGATNRPQDLDPALLSRFDTIIDFPYPGQSDIEAMLALLARHLSAEEKSRLAQALSGLSPRSIRDVCKNAERRQARVLIQAGSGEIAPPPLDFYLELARQQNAI